MQLHLLRERMTQQQHQSESDQESGASSIKPVYLRGDDHLSVLSVANHQPSVPERGPLSVFGFDLYSPQRALPVGTILEGLQHPPPTMAAL